MWSLLLTELPQERSTQQETVRTSECCFEIETASHAIHVATLRDVSNNTFSLIHSLESHQEYSVRSFSRKFPKLPHHVKSMAKSRMPIGTTVSWQTVYRRLRHIGLYARRPVRCVPLTATHCRLRLTWIREHALWTPQQWSCEMFSDESRFSLQSDSRQTLIWREPGTRYHQENTIERRRYGGAGWLVRGGIILGSRTD
ncbi:transposable element Tcb2 transposase [Trichonephila clavipes]|nr:transposable element Tcb2 transposase [Trichonephila clavipes]